MKKVFFCSVFLSFLAVIHLSARNFSVNRKGIATYSIVNKASGQCLTVTSEGKIATSATPAAWRLSSLDSLLFYLDYVSAESTHHSRLRATSYLPMSLTTNGLEGRNNDVQWSFVPATENGDWGYLVHKSSGRYLSAKGTAVSVVEFSADNDQLKWKMDLQKVNLNELESPIILMGDDQAGFRDPLLIYEGGYFYIYYSYVLTEEQEKIYWYVAMSKSRDLVYWTDPVILTEKDQSKNFASPGSIVRYKGDWVMCMQTYSMPNYTRKDPIRYGDANCRLWVMRSKDLEHWGAPEMLEMDGPGVKTTRMIDACILKDKDDPDKWWCFYVPVGAGAGYAWSRDLKEWHPYGRTRAGENTCVWSEGDTYYMMHSPHDGMGILQSKDLKNWTVFTEPDNLGKKDWPWASRRVTAGFVLDLRKDKRVGKYVMVFHGQGPSPQSTEIINSGTDLGIAWSDDLKTWEWPGKNR